MENVSSLAAARAFREINDNPVTAIYVTEELMLNPHTATQAAAINQRFGEEAASLYLSLFELLQSGEELPADEDIKPLLLKMLPERTVLNLLLLKREDATLTREELEATEHMMNRIIGSMVLHAYAKRAYQRKYPSLSRD